MLAFFSPCMEILKETCMLRRMLPSDLQDVRISVAIIMKRRGEKKRCYCDFSERAAGSIITS